MAYASALRQERSTQRITYGERPRSLDVLAPTETETTDIIQAITQHPLLKTQKDKIISIFKIGKNTHNLTFEKNNNTEQLKQSFIFQASEGIETTHGKIYLQLPRKPTARINIRAVPTEVEDDEIRRKLEKYGCGLIVEIKRIYHKGTSIQNGYRQILVENYIEGRVPPFIYLGKAPCKVYLPSDNENERCFKCLLTGHSAKNCPNETTCMECKRSGHRRENCPEIPPPPPIPPRHSPEMRDKSIVETVENKQQPESAIQTQQCQDDNAATQESEAIPCGQIEVDPNDKNKTNKMTTEESEGEELDLFGNPFPSARGDSEEVAESSNSEANTTVRQDLELSDKDSFNEGRLAIITSEEESITQEENQTKKSNKNETPKTGPNVKSDKTPKPKQKGSSTFTEKEFFSAPSPNKRREENPNVVNTRHQAKKKLGEGDKHKPKH